MHTYCILKFQFSVILVTFLKHKLYISFLLCISILFLLDVVYVHNSLFFCYSLKNLFFVHFRKVIEEKKSKFFIKKNTKKQFFYAVQNFYTYILYFAIAFEDLYVAAYHLFTESICIYTFSSFLLFCNFIYKSS